MRWWIIGLIFLATLINYIDQLTISVLAWVITRDLGLSASVTINFHRNEAGAATVRDEINSKGGSAIAVQADVTRTSEVEALANERSLNLDRSTSW